MGSSKALTVKHSVCNDVFTACTWSECSAHSEPHRTPLPVIKRVKVDSEWIIIIQDASVLWRKDSIHEKAHHNDSTHCSSTSTFEALWRCCCSRAEKR